MITIQTKRKPVELTPRGEGYIYRGFRLVPNYYSPATGRPINTPKGWTCPDFRQEGMSRMAWYATLADFAEDIDRTYTLVAEGKARSDRKAALGRACENLNPHEAAEVRALVAECNRKQAAAEAERRAAQAAQAAAHDAQQRLHNAAPAMLEALHKLLSDVEAAVDFGCPFDDPNNNFHESVMAARAAIAAATGKA